MNPSLGDRGRGRSLAVATILATVGLVNGLPVVGILSGEALARLYGIEPPTGELLILMRHRALLFGLLGAFLIAAAFRRRLQPAAIIAGLASMLGFVALALGEGSSSAPLQKVVIVDLVASVALFVAAVLRVVSSDSAL